MIGTLGLKNRLVRLLRSSALQPFWEFLHHTALVGMNYWGGASLHESGEKVALRYMRRRIQGAHPVVIFDVGANIGEYAVEVIHAFGPAARVFCFEPSASAFRRLVERSAHFATVLPLNFGLTDVAALRRLDAPEPGSVKASLYGPNVGQEGSFNETVRLETVDDFCLREGIERIHVLKIDVEGHEYRVLTGAQRMIQAGRVQFIQFEFGDRHIDSRTFFRDFHQLLSAKYQLYRIVPDGLRLIGGYTAELEVFATVNFLAELKGDGDVRPPI